MILFPSSVQFSHSVMSDSLWAHGLQHTRLPCLSPIIAYYSLVEKQRNVLRFSSIQFSHSVVSDSLRPHELQHARPPCPSPAPGVYPNSCPLSGWCHPTLSSSVIPFSSCSQSFPASGYFPMCLLFIFVGQSIGASASLVIICKYFLPFSRLSFHFVSGFLCCAKAFKFN